MSVLMKCGCVSHSVVTAIKGAPVDPPQPSCVVHDCMEVAETKPDLTGRQAKCTYRHDGPKRPGSHQQPGPSPVPSSYDLAFFEYCGPGSRQAIEYCVCGYLKVAHDKDGGRCPSGQTLTGERGAGGMFQAQGPLEYDRFYCGCFGWD